ncbi:MAG: histidine kinase [Clostridiales Family XIII bacterium]|jgi:sensor histidine kinase YesM|nr:histidine kinase [Clostridiales Family XIII bacterium]
MDFFTAKIRGFLSKSRSISIFATIFIVLCIMLITLFVLFTLIWYRNESKQVTDLMLSVIETSAENISESVDKNINAMDSISYQIANSPDINSNLEYLFTSYDSLIYDPNYYEYDDSINALRESLFAYTGTQKSADQINIFLSDGKMVASGLSNNLYVIPVGSREYKRILAEYENVTTVYYSGKNPIISRYYISPVGKHFLSLIRLDTNYPDNQYAIIEIKKSLAHSLSAAATYTQQYQEQLMMFDHYANQLFPIDASPENTAYYDAILKARQASQAQSGVVPYRDPDTRDTTYLIYQYSPYSKITTAFSIDKDYLMANIYDNFKSFIPLLIAMVGLIIIASLFIAMRISRPINNIYNRIKISDLESIGALPETLDTNLLEINTFLKSLRLLHARLQEANARQMMLQKQEMQSKMLSLQSQMNPHFLYNSLSTIQAMAAEGMFQEIALMCQTTARILRYISSDKEPLVPLAMEISHTEDYLQSMQIRYSGDLSYDISIPDEMKDIMIPKLCVQLLVENAVKFTTKNKPPWRITVLGTLAGYKDASGWLLSVKDNGPGFTEEKRNELYQKIEEIDRTVLLPSLELKGMGLLNIYIRLKLLYEDNHVFFINNVASGGSEIIIGGKNE